ncbi:MULTISPECIES: hypothetical protein [Sphingobacterium]|uniref:Uncharacterized protein n=1 Tax=Sphingobacterium populi TaxID=1812824 RepID=A0ABW5U8M6_9SPHI|nr:hypothetical protein [Sphingobacterium sp. CFCC 11742]
MIKWNRFLSFSAIVIYSIIALVTYFYVQHFLENARLHTIISISINVISVAGFLVTINQLMTVRENETANRKETQKELQNYFNTLVFQDLTMKFHVLDSTESDIRGDRWEDSLRGLRDITKLLDILETLISKLNLEIDLDTVAVYRRSINHHISLVERKIQFPTAKITKQDITSNLRDLSTLIHKQIISLKANTYNGENI